MVVLEALLTSGNTSESIHSDLSPDWAIQFDGGTGVNLLTEQHHAIIGYIVWSFKQSLCTCKISHCTLHDQDGHDMCTAYMWFGMHAYA